MAFDAQYVVDYTLYVHIRRQLHLTARDLDYRSGGARSPFWCATPRFDPFAFLAAQDIWAERGSGM